MPTFPGGKVDRRQAGRMRNAGRNVTIQEIPQTSTGVSAYSVHPTVSLTCHPSPFLTRPSVRTGAPSPRERVLFPSLGHGVSIVCAAALFWSYSFLHSSGCLPNLSRLAVPHPPQCAHWGTLSPGEGIISFLGAWCHYRLRCCPFLELQLSPFIRLPP